MTDQQKVQLLPCPWCGHALVERRNRMNPYASCETSGCFMQRCPVVNLDYAPDIEAWNTRQAAIAHASSATGKENLTVGEGEAVARKLRQWAARINNNGSYAERDLLLLAASMIEVSGAPSAEDAKRIDKLQSIIDSGQRLEFAKSLLGNGVEIGVRFPCRAIVADSLREAIDQALAADLDDA